MASDPDDNKLTANLQVEPINHVLQTVTVWVVSAPWFEKKGSLLEWHTSSWNHGQSYEALSFSPSVSLWLWREQCRRFRLRTCISRLWFQQYISSCDACIIWSDSYNAPIYFFIYLIIYLFQTVMKETSSLFCFSWLPHGLPLILRGVGGVCWCVCKCWKLHETSISCGSTLAFMHMWLNVCMAREDMHDRAQQPRPTCKLIRDGLFFF